MGIPTGIPNGNSHVNFRCQLMGGILVKGIAICVPSVFQMEPRWNAEFHTISGNTTRPQGFRDMQPAPPALKGEGFALSPAEVYEGLRPSNS